MPNGEDWIMRPVLEGCIKYESLIDGSLDLGDIARINAALEVKWKNEATRAKLREAEDGSGR
jgi:hypothetical protein